MEHKSEFPPLSELMPHTPPMVLIEQVIAWQPDSVICTAVIDARRFSLTSSDKLGTWIGIELIAQAAAAWAGMRSRARGTRRQGGVLLSVRNFKFYEPHFLHDQAIVIRADAKVQSDKTALFEGHVSDAQNSQPLVSGRITVYEPPEYEPFFETRQ